MRRSRWRIPILLQPTNLSGISERRKPWEGLTKPSPRPVIEMQTRLHGLEIQGNDLCIGVGIRRWDRILIIGVRPACEARRAILIPLSAIDQRNAGQLLCHDLLDAGNSLLLGCRIG